MRLYMLLIYKLSENLLLIFSKSLNVTGAKNCCTVLGTISLKVSFACQYEINSILDNFIKCKTLQKLQDTECMFLFL